MKRYRKSIVQAKKEAHNEILKCIAEIMTLWGGIEDHAKDIIYIKNLKNLEYHIIKINRYYQKIMTLIRKGHLMYRSFEKRFGLSANDYKKEIEK